MSNKLIRFIGKKNQPVNPIGGPALSSLGPKKSDDGKIVDHGKLGNLDYEIYNRGVIHIFDKDGLRFKKDIYIFEEEIKKISFDKMIDGDCREIKGSGDNDNLVFSKKDADIGISLKRKEFKALELLKDVLNKGKQKLSK